MVDVNSSRRRFVASGVSAGMALLAGCSGGSDDGSTNSGGSSGSVVLEVTDQSGDGSSLIVERASAPVEFAIDVHADTTSGSKGPFQKNEEVENAEVTLDPPLETNTTLEVSLHNEANGQHIEQTEIRYTVA